MAHSDFTFPPAETDDTKQKLIIFDAIKDGNTTVCNLAYALIDEHYEGEYSDPLFAFMQVRTEVEGIAARLIEQGRFEDDGSIVITEADIKA
ncbi:MAG TPA: DUF1488 family protein [Chromatiaceae bacterium]|jgi:hypothetical protein|nr:DUF1488 family protein [Chromatiaceae bacterium]HIB83254.1 DUF1488 family protein [Chromatiaceae bacterium]HIN81616.1 DUF1488 family protein [Chromatiales bacterium]HIO02947.1 DUF1488 family protein [Alphaproteobacteria bacterium]